MPIPFDPDKSWGAKPRHPLTGSVAGRPMRGNIEKGEGGPVIALGPAWCRVALRDGAEVEVVLAPEGPQRADAPGLHVDRLVDGLWRHPHLRVIGELHTQPASDLLR